MKNKVEQNNLSRGHLETLTSSQLIELADEYGIDIPDNLNRQFIIAELLEVAKEINDNLNYKETIKISEELKNEIKTDLPTSYNETYIDLILRNPMSLFVFWDFNEAQIRQLASTKTPIHLQVCFFDDKEAEESEDAFDIQINYDDREQYILIPNGKKVVQVGLIQDGINSVDSVLAVSGKIEIAHCSDEFKDFQPGMDLKIKPILELSGIKNILKNHYNNYRQFFN